MTGRQAAALLRRLTAEAIPVRPDGPPPPAPWTDADRDRHWHTLCHAVGAPREQRPGDTPETAT